MIGLRGWSVSEFQQGALLTALGTVLGAVLGFLLILLERKRAELEVDKRRSAAWLLTPMNGYTWFFTNTGDAAAFSIQLDADDGDPCDTPDSFNLEPGESVPVRVHIPLNNGGKPAASDLVDIPPRRAQRARPSIPGRPSNNVAERSNDALQVMSGRSTERLTTLRALRWRVYRFEVIGP